MAEKKTPHHRRTLTRLWAKNALSGQTVLIDGKRVTVRRTLRGIPGSCEIFPPVLGFTYWNISGMKLPEGDD